MFELEDTTYLGKAVPSQGGGTAINNLDVTVTPETTAQTLTVPSEYTGYGTISVNAVTSDIDENIEAGNIKDGVTILGVEGTLQSAETIEATNLSGSSIAVGDKVYLKRQTAQQQSRTEKTNLNSKNILINPAGSKVMSPTFIYDISTDTKTTVSGITPNDYRVIKYKGQYIFCGQNIFGDGVSTSPFTWYAQGNYGVTDPGDYTGFIVRKYDDTLSNVLQTWNVSFLAYNMCEWCVVKNHIYAISFRDSAYKLFEGTIDDSSQTISMTQAQVVSQSDITASRYPAQTTIDDKIGIFANAKQGISLTRMNDDGSISGQFLSSNTDLSGIVLSGVGTVFNKYTGILTSETISSDGNGGYSATAYIFKYNPTTVDFDTVSIISNIPSNSDYSSSYNGYYTTSVSNDLSKMVVNTYQMQTHLMNLAVAEGGYNAVPYSMGQDIMTGFAAEAAESNATFSVKANSYPISSKFGATVNTFFGNVDSNGVLSLPSDRAVITLTGVTKVNADVLARKFSVYNTGVSFSNGITELNCPDLIEVMGSSFAQAAYGVDSLTKFTAPNLTTVSGGYAFYEAFAYTSLASISFPKVTILSTPNAMQSMCKSCTTTLTSASFDLLTTLSGNSCLSEAFNNCRVLTTLLLPELATVSGNSAMNGLVRECQALASLSLSKLATLSGTNCAQYLAYNTAISTMTFTALSDVSGSGCLMYSFSTCKLLTSLSFPALTTTSFGSYVNQFQNMFNSNTAATSEAFTVHFPSNLESTIQGLTGYPNFGATAARITLSFDLPATS